MNISLKKELKLEFDIASKKESQKLLDDLEKCNETLLITPNIASLHHQRAKILHFFTLSQLHLNRYSVAEELYIQAANAYQQSIQLDPNESYFYLHWTSMLYNYAKILYEKNKVDVASHFLRKACNKANELCMQVSDKYENVIETDIDEQHYVYLDIADAFIDMAILYFELEYLEKAEELYRQACAKYEQAIILNSQNPDLYLDWGYSLSQLATIRLKYKDFAKAEELYKQACYKYEQAIAVDGKYQYAETHLDWGYSLSQLATIRLKYKDFAKAEELYKQACYKYEQTIAMDDKNTDAYINWGYSLESLAEIQFALGCLSKAEEFHLQACSKYEKAILINPDEIAAYSMWGTTLRNLAKLKAQQGHLEAAEDLYVQACSKYMHVYKANGRAYNLARIYALINDKDNALKFLQISLQNNELNVEVILTDDAWKCFLNDAEFKKAIKHVR